MNNIGNNIGRINGFGNYGVGGYVPQRNNEAPEEQVQQPVVQNHEEQLVDSSKVLEFMEANNIYVAPKTVTTPAELDPEVQDRVVDAMARFEEIYPIVVNEFGEELAPTIMDIVMDKLLGM